MFSTLFNFVNCIVATFVAIVCCKTMGFFAFIGIVTILYYLISIIFWIVLDSDIELWCKQRWGKRIESLRGKVVWITGASSGIGKQLAIELAKNHVKLCISARSEDRLRAVKEECLKQSKLLNANDVFVLKMDMTDIDSHQRYFDTVVNHFGRLDILVNNAGRSQRASFEEIDLQVDRELFELDVFSVVNLARIYVKHCKGQGHVAVTSSAAGIISAPNSASYTAAKHAIHGYFESLKLEHPSMDVTLFCPGPTQTDFLQHAFTGKQGQSYNIAAPPTDRRMTAERCAFLMATALANKCEINFVGPFPVPALVYISCYYPNLRKLILMVLGKSGIAKIRDPAPQQQ